MHYSKIIEDKIKHFFEAISDFISSFYGWATMLFTVIITNDTTMLFSLLFTLLVSDYITGILASYIEFKRSGQVAPVYITQSERLRGSGVKVVGYFLVVVLAWFISNNIYTDKISLFGVIKELDVLQLSLIMCSGIEFWSNLENMKRAGFDIVGKFENITKRIWNLVRSSQGR